MPTSARYGWVLHAGGWSLGQPLSSAEPRYGQAMAAFFLAIVFCQLANVFVWRTTHQSVFTKGLLRNRYVLVGIALEVVLLVVAVATGPGRAVFDTASPPLGAWLVPVPFALAMLGISEAKKAVARRR